MTGLRGFFGRETEEQRQVRDRTRGELLFVEREEVSEVARWGHILQTKFGDRLGEGASEAGGLSDGGKIEQFFRRRGGVNDARGERFNAETGDGSKSEAAHGLSGEIGDELREGECVNALATRWESADSEFICRGSRGGNDEDFSVFGFLGEERGGALDECGVGSGMKERARGHRQLYWGSDVMVAR